jgi:hypothetical protein
MLCSSDKKVQNKKAPRKVAQFKKNKSKQETIIKDTNKNTKRPRMASVTTAKVLSPR